MCLQMCGQEKPLIYYVICAQHHISDSDSTSQSAILDQTQSDIQLEVI